MSCTPSPGDLVRALTALDVPDCGCKIHFAKLCSCDCECDCPRCPVSPPCEHILAADHTLTLEQWQELLEETWPADYREPPVAPHGELVQSRQVRLAIYEERASLGFALWHREDCWQANEQHEDALAIGTLSSRGGKLKRLKNGRPNPHQELGTDAALTQEEERRRKVPVLGKE